MTTVLIVDDHTPFRSVARALLESEGYEVVGEASDGASAVSAAEALRPAIVLLDVQLPDASGFDVAEELAERFPAVRIVMTSSRDRSAFSGRLAASRARGFVAKADLSRGTIEAVLSS